jgi:hypothetical protein
MAFERRWCRKIGLLTGMATAALAGLPPAPALAADMTAAQAASLEQQVRDALGGLLGPTVTLGDRPVRLTPAGDHLDVVVPLPYAMPPDPGAPAGGASSDVQVTATARPAENGVWLIDGVRLTSPLRFVLQMPVPPAPGTPAPPADRDAKRPTAPMLFTTTTQGQDGRAVWDPSFATPSTWTVSSQSTTVHAEGPRTVQDTRVGPANAVTTLRPAGPDRFDVLFDGTLQDYQLDSSANGDPVHVGVQRTRASGALNGVGRTQAVALVQSLASIASGMTAAAAPMDVPAKPRIAPELIRGVLGALQNFASDFSFDETLDGFIVKGAGQSVAMDRMRLEFDAKSDAGLLRAGMAVAMDGLALPELPLGDMASLLPRRIAFHPVIGGVAVSDLMRLASLSSEHRKAGPDDIAALFSHGGITGGLQSLELQVGGAVLTGNASLLATGPGADQITGTAQLSAENFDALIQKMSAFPPLAQQAMPVLVFIKGIGRTVENKLVWDISYRAGKLLVNNMDLSAMAGTAGPSRPPDGPRKAPAPKQTPR